MLAQGELLRARPDELTARSPADLPQRRILSAGANFLTVVHQPAVAGLDGMALRGIAQSDAVDGDGLGASALDAGAPFAVAGGVVAIGKEQDIAGAGSAFL